MSNDRRRLQPLRLDRPENAGPAPAAPPPTGAGSAAPQPPPPLPAPPPPHAAARASSGTSVVIVLSIVVLAVAVVACGIIIRLVLRDPAPSAVATPTATTTTAPPPTNAPPVATPPWTSLLTGPGCPLPCSDGASCAAPGSRTCSSGFTCIPGDRSDELEPGQKWNLILSAIWEKGEKGSVSSCTAPSGLRSGKVCIRPASASRATCVAVSDPCTHGARATTPVPVTTEDLTREAFTIEIRNRSDFPVASRTGVLYSTGLQRSALCIGAKAGKFKDLAGADMAGGDVQLVMFYLEPRP